MNSPLKKHLAEIALLITAAIWGFAFVAQRIAMLHMGPFGFIASRFILGGALIAILLAFTGKLTSISRKDFALGGMLGIVLFLGASFQQIAMVTTSAGKAGFITGLYIALIPIMLWLYERRFTSLTTWTGIFLALVGLYLLSVSESFTIEFGDSILFLSAIVFALHMILAERWVSSQDPLVLAMIQFFVTGIAGLIVALLSEPFTVTQIKAAWEAILYAGVLSTAVGYTAQLVGQRYTSSVTAGIILSLECVFAALAGWLLLSEQFTSRQEFGCVLILVGTILAQLPTLSKAQQTPA